jgi:hypothetical protein
LIVKASKKESLLIIENCIHLPAVLKAEGNLGIDFTHQENDYIDFCTEINSSSVLIEEPL